jgi:hypothetical protein
MEKAGNTMWKLIVNENCKRASVIASKLSNIAPPDVADRDAYTMLIAILILPA